MKPREYCCCAIPIVNVGIYATLTEQLIAATLVGALSIATPRIVGAATPALASWVLAAICFSVAAIQVLGFIGVSREKPILFRRYVTLHGILVSAAFSAAAAWIVISAIRHDSAKNRCLSDFFSDDSSSSSQASTLCDIFPWIGVGVMGGLWAVLAIFHLYLFVVLSSYGASQRVDHEKYDQLNSENIPMTKRSDVWDPRPSADLEVGGGNTHGHHRQESASEILSQPHMQPKDTFSDVSNNGYTYYLGPVHPHNNLHREPSTRGYGARPTPSYD